MNLLKFLFSVWTSDTITNGKAFVLNGNIHGKFWMEKYRFYLRYLYIGWEKNPERVKYLENKTFLRKMFWTKVVGF